MKPTPHDFLLHLRTARPPLARRLDGIRGLERSGGSLLIRVPQASWAFRELTAWTPALTDEVRFFFGAGVAVKIEATAPAPEILPFPVLASKVWNHAAFWVWGPAGNGALVVPKPTYLETWLPAAQTAGDAAISLETASPGVWIPGVPAAAGSEVGPEDCLAGLLDQLCERARAAFSYVHLVAAFPGDPVADRLEGRLYAVKEWGTPKTPAGILQKFVGRLHYVDPERPVLGARLASRSLHGFSHSA